MQGEDEAADRSPSLSAVTMASAYVTSDRLQDLFRRAGSSSGYPEEYGLAKRLEAVATLVKAGLQTRVYYAELDGFDTHSSQFHTHASLLRELGDSLQASLPCPCSAASIQSFRFSSLRAEGKHQDCGSGSVHRRLVGGIVADVIVVHGPRVLERGQRIGLSDRDAEEALVVLEPLRLPVGKVHHPRSTLAPTVVSHFVLGKAPIQCDRGRRPPGDRVDRGRGAA